MAEEGKIGRVAVQKHWDTIYGKIIGKGENAVGDRIGSERKRGGVQRVSKYFGIKGNSVGNDAVKEKVNIVVNNCIDEFRSTPRLPSSWQRARCYLYYGIYFPAFPCSLLYNSTCAEDPSAPLFSPPSSSQHLSLSCLRETTLGLSEEAPNGYGKDSSSYSSGKVDKSLSSIAF